MYQIKNRSQKFMLPKIGEITLSGYSRSKYRTGYLIQPFNIYLDAGLPSPVPANVVLLSHSHLDHIDGLYSILIESHNTPVMLPSCIKDNVSNLLDANYSLSGKKKKFKNWNPITTSNFSKMINSKNIIFNTYELDHTVSCLGYSIDFQNKKLKEEYKDYKGKQLAELKKSGVEITENYTIQLILFISDTGKNGITNLPFDQYPLIIIECTFLDDEHYTEAVSRKHLHWKDLEPIVKTNPTNTFILGHFSCRYKDEYLIEFEKAIIVNYSNVIFWI